MILEYRIRRLLRGRRFIEIGILDEDITVLGHVLVLEPHDWQ